MRGIGILQVGVSIAVSFAAVACGGAESYVRTPVRADASTWNTILANAQLMNCSAKGPDPVNGLVLECEDSGTIVFGRDQGDDARIIDDETHYLLEGRCSGSAAKFCGALVGQLVSAKDPSGNPTTPSTATATATAVATGGPPSSGTTGDAELKGCMPGRSLAECAKSFKAKTPPVEEMNFAFLPQYGIELGLEDDKKTIRALFIHFFSKKEGAYKKTYRGIGATSTETDIFAEFGHPTDVDDSVVSQYGEYPGAQEHNIYYSGFRFQYLDGKLALIGIFPPDPK